MFANGARLKKFFLQTIHLYLQLKIRSMRRNVIIFVSLAVSGIFLTSCEEDVERFCFSASDRAPKANSRVTFNASCSEGVELYHWNFGDGTDEVTKTSSVEHVFEYPGTYEVSLHGTQAQIQNHCPPEAGPTGARQTIEVQN